MKSLFNNLIRHIRTVEIARINMIHSELDRRPQDRDRSRFILWRQQSLMAFHHPKLVAQHIHEKREPVLKLVLDSILKGLDLKV